MDTHEFVRRMAQLFLDNRGDTENLSLHDIRDCVETACAQTEQLHEIAVSPEIRNAVILELEGQYQTVISEVRVLVGKDEGWDPWLPERSGSITWRHWDRYLKHLQKGPMGTAVLNKLDDTTETAMGYLGDPMRKSSWDRRGLVVGLVQSGKTSHYLGVVNRALDSGYKVIVILTGFTESLRVQTQLRTEEGSLGYYMTPDNRAVITGVGTIDPGIRPDSVTTRKYDFRAAVAQNFQIGVGSTPLVFVVKKNAFVLRNLIRWIENFGNATDEDGRRFVKGEPLLLIDDESDVGSIDTSAGAVEGGVVNEEQNPTTINRRIRKLLHLFDQSSYVGYTATPFANVLIHDDARTKEFGGDLFPRSFIMSLPTPSNHVGPVMVFGRETEDGEREDSLPVTRPIPLSEVWYDSQEDETRKWIPPVHKKHCLPLWEGREEIPPSLRQALLSFILVCAARRIRSTGTKHNSMLIHVTRFNNVQEEVREQVRDELRGIENRLRLGTGDRQLIRDLEKLWIEDFTKTTRTIAHRDGAIFQNRTHSWEDIRKELLNAAASIQVRAINGQAGEVLDYEEHKTTGLHVIAIGGDKLSRGLTLDGLSVSYFERASRMYDTLMQMGRWFGYRPGYLDLCRLYTTPDLLEWFAHIADATEELRDEINQMELSGGTPADYGLRIRSHPSLMVTSRVKMRNGSERSLTFHGKHIETDNFLRDPETVSQNWNAVKQLVHTCEQGGNGIQTVDGKDAAWRGVPADAVTRFLEAYKTSDEEFQFQPKYLTEYIEAENERDRLTEWTILIAQGDGEAPQPQDRFGESTHIRTVQRTWPNRLSDEERTRLQEENRFRTGIIKSPTDEWIDMPPGTQEYRDALDLTIEDYKKSPGRRKSEPRVPAGRFLRQLRDERKGLLIIYPIQATEENSEEKNASTPITGCVLSFPSVRNASSVSQVTYIVGNVYQQQEQLSLWD